MKTNLLLFSLICTYAAFSQVGIGTLDPTASLDINGDVRIRTVNAESNLDVAKDSILVVSRDGVVKSIPSKTVIEKGLPSTVKGTFSGSGAVNLTLASGSEIIPFNAVDFDTNNEYDLGTATFTAKQDGIYAVNVQIKASSGIAVATNFGVQIMKNNMVENRNSYANVGVTIAFVTINVTSPIRNSQTLVQLDKDDTINFEVVSSLASVNLLGNDEDSFFTIHQIR